MPLLPDGRASGRKWLVSNGGGYRPIWSQNGREPFYENFDRYIRVVAYTIKSDLFVAAKPRLWSDKHLADIGFFPSFDVAPDGKRVLALFGSDEAKPDTNLHVLLNVDDELQRRTPAQRK